VGRKLCNRATATVNSVAILDSIKSVMVSPNENVSTKYILLLIVLIFQFVVIIYWNKETVVHYSLSLSFMHC